MATASAPDVQTTALLRNLISALEDKKAEQLTVLHVGGVSDITDYLVLATGNSEPHLRALRIEAEKVLDAAKIKIAGMEQGGFGSGWTVVDAYQIMVHFFTAEQRGNYALEKLWKDAPEVNLKTLAPKAAPKAVAAKKAKVVVAKKKPVAKATEKTSARASKAKATAAVKKPTMVKAAKPTKPAVAKKKPNVKKA
jgi:ribosome-associated protein